MDEDKVPVESQLLVTKHDQFVAFRCSIPRSNGIPVMTCVYVYKQMSLEEVQAISPAIVQEIQGMLDLCFP